MHLLASIKQVPDTTNIRIDPETGSMIRKGVPAILNPYDAHAVAAAAEWKRKLDGKLTVITMGPPAAKEALQECIEMGADRAILISDRKFAGSDTLATSYVLAEAIRKIDQDDPVDLVFFGKQAIDGDTAQVGPGAAIRLGLPLITYAVEISEINVDEKYAVIVRKTESGKEIIQTSLPAALTAEKAIAEIPYAALPDLITSLKFIPEVWSADEPLAYDENQIGLSGSPTMVAKSGTPEAHEPAETISVAEQGLSGAVEIILGKMLSNSSVASLLEELK
ncbi:MAG TPA: electron transfer flavoprotein beta subunit/FixA family protein [Chloroflexi bacterium]|nr:MAG: electron transfer flavoprotein subunit beta [Chloroflexota bacterium]HDD54920.1 electron transfer flavoprotein beta subunit/FixA family protein [Chloroflexota bacterium]